MGIFKHCVTICADAKLGSLLGSLP
jgi:hypothetical protein